MTYPLENLFRPAVERYAAIASLAAASGVIAWPEVLMLTPTAGLLVVTLLFAYALHREGQARRVLRFHRHLRQPPHYALAANRIPGSRPQLFLAHETRVTRLHARARVNWLKSANGRPRVSRTRNPNAFRACRCVATATRCRVARSDRKSRI